MANVEQTDVPINICERPDIDRDGIMEGGGEFLIDTSDVAEALDNALDLPDGFRNAYYLAVTIDTYCATAMTLKFTFRRRGE